MSMVADMSDQCRIIESIMVYNEWIFSPESTEPPPIVENSMSAAVAPISETMSNMTNADIAALTNSKLYKLPVAFLTSINKRWFK